MNDHLHMRGASRGRDGEQLSLQADNVLAVTSDVPSMSTPGYLWERWLTPLGGTVEIVGERPRPRTSRHRGSVGVIWQCTQCPTIASDRSRLGTSRGAAIRHLVFHARALDAASAQCGQPPERASSDLSLPRGWAPHPTTAWETPR